jgi:hypothetical protein
MRPDLPKLKWDALPLSESNQLAPGLAPTVYRAELSDAKGWLFFTVGSPVFFVPKPESKDASG